MKTGSPPQAIALMSEFKTFCFLYGLACLWKFFPPMSTVHLSHLSRHKFLAPVFLENSMTFSYRVWLAKKIISNNLFFLRFIFGSQIYFTFELCYIVLYCIESIVIQGGFLLWPCNKWDHYSRSFFHTLVPQRNQIRFYFMHFNSKLMWRAAGFKLWICQRFPRSTFIEQQKQTRARSKQGHLSRRARQRPSGAAAKALGTFGWPLRH